MKKKDFLISGLFLSIFICNTHFATGQKDFWQKYCGESGNYTQTSKYKQDLDEVLSNSFLSTNNGFGFYNFSFGQVKAAAVCRGDMEPESCQRCADDATRMVRKVCPNQMEAAGWYDTCFFRYSNRTMSNLDGYYTTNSQSISDKNYYQWNQTLRTSLESWRKEAASGGPLRKYASGKVTILNANLTIYGIMQCTPDFSETECDDCLNSAARFNLYLNSSLGLRHYTPNCIIRYEIYPFFNSTWNPPPPTASAPLQAPSPSGSPSGPSGNTKRSRVGVTVGLVLVLLVVMVMVIVFFIFLRRQKMKRHADPFLLGLGDKSSEGSNKYEREDDDADDMNYFNLSTIMAATDNFSLDNKLGEGGFGPVYKGKLQDGKEIAVKRLSSNSSQGLVEFKTEVKLIIKLQHKNLVRLLGYCVKGSERLLIYEFMVNNSLDTFLFDPNKSKELDWPMRTNIVIGIAKGLRYLHEDSRLKIIHRDMKAGNILLDSEMNSKISDFGTARIFGGNQMEAATNRIVGTYGYMAPEYAMEGLFSTKSDVYSFGVLMLEIISGQRNNKFIYNDRPENFLSTAWSLWKENKGEEFIDRFLIQECPINDALRWINIALLCVQEDPQDRPTMSIVVFMLEGQWSENLPTPSEPPLSFARFATVSEYSATTDTATGDASEHPSTNLESSTTGSC